MYLNNKKNKINLEGITAQRGTHTRARAHTQTHAHTQIFHLQIHSPSGWNWATPKMPGTSSSPSCGWQGPQKFGNLQQLFRTN